MIKDILIVVKERQVFEQIKRACGQSFGNDYIFIVAQNIQAAIDLLRERHVALVLLEQLRPKKHTLSLLSYIWKFFPDITVLNMAGHRESPDSIIVEEEGLSVQSAKMLPDKDWPKVIHNALRAEQKDGSLYISDVSLFVQMIQQEQRTCTLRVYDDSHRRVGILFFQDGELKNARLKTVQGKMAACEVLTWKAVWIDIQNTCNVVSPQIHTNLQAILIEGQINKDNADEYEATSSWVAAAKKEARHYRKLLDDIQIDQIPKEKKTNTVHSKPDQTAPVNIFRRFIPMTFAAVLVLFSAMAYMTSLYQKDGIVQKSRLQEIGSAPHTLPESGNPVPTGSSAGNQIKIKKLPATTVSAKKRIANKKDTPASPTFDKQHLLTSGALKTKQATTQQPLNIFLHYTFIKNHALVEQLVHYLTTKGFIVQGVEQVKYNKNEIRYFQTADQKNAQILRECISSFFKSLHPPKDTVWFRLRNLSKSYPQVPDGQIEIWLRLPPT